VTDNHVMRRALEYAATYDMTVFLQPQDPWLASKGCAHEGAVAARLGLAGIPVAAETVALAGLLELVAQTGTRAHFGRLSAGRALQMIGQAKAEGLPVSADVSINHLHLTEIDILDFNAYCHVRPPLRTQRDREALRQALGDGTLDAVCSDHQPHEPDAKLLPFPSTQAGISGLETLLPLMLQLVDEGVLNLLNALGLLTHRPAQVLGLNAGRLSPGARADVCVFDPNARRTLAPERLYSAGKNTPFGGWNLRGKVTHLLLDGRPLTWHWADEAT
jgi:dihydroorotase